MVCYLKAHIPVIRHLSVNCVTGFCRIIATRVPQIIMIELYCCGPDYCTSSKGEVFGLQVELLMCVLTMDNIEGTSARSPA